MNDRTNKRRAKRDLERAGKVWLKVEINTEHLSEADRAKLTTGLKSLGGIRTQGWVRPDVAERFYAEIVRELVEEAARVARLGVEEGQVRRGPSGLLYLVTHIEVPRVTIQYVREDGEWTLDPQEVWLIDNVASDSIVPRRSER